MDTDRNLLFGVLALQADLISSEQFAEACKEWARRKDRPLGELLIERGWITGSDHADVERLLERKLKKHSQDVRASLAALLSTDVRGSLAAVEDSEIAHAVTTLDATGAHDSFLIPPVPLTRERYTLTRFHKMGGIGRIWLARDDHLGRNVALKELRPDRDQGPASRARFLREARITGQLEHPGIVPVYELGKRPENQQPFYTMRFVEGRTLSAAAASYHQQRHAGKADLFGLRGLLNAFVAVCNAVAYSHARGVVHRDLKGDNVLLGEFGEVIVLDWGLAKVLGQAEDRLRKPPVETNEDPALQRTLEGQVIGTVPYMAPEQAAGEVDRIEPRTDVYGLGAILYEILTGRPPFTGENYYEVLHRVQTEKPMRPRQFWAGVPPALEAVCLRALAKKREQRYLSAREIAQEVERWLADEPVAAYAEGWTIKARRWSRRHRPVVAAVGALLLTAMVVLSISTVLIRQREQAAQSARELAEQQRDRADQNLRLARQAVDNTVTKVTADPRLKHANFHRLRHDLLASMVPFYEQFVRQRQDDPALEAERGRAWHSLAALRHEMGQNDTARSDYEEIRGLFAHLTAEFPTVPEYRRDLARNHNSLGVLLASLGKRDEAEAVYCEALKIQTQLAAEFPGVPEYQQELANIHNNLSILLDDLGKRGDAEKVCRDALKIRKQLAAGFPTSAEYHLDVAISHNNLANVLRHLNRPVEAEAAYRDALKILAQLVADYPGVPQYRVNLAASHYNLGTVLRDMNKVAEAEAACRDALKIQLQLAADFPDVPEYRQELARSHRSLGNLLQESNKAAEAETAYRDALKIEAQLAAEFPNVPGYRAGLAGSYRNLGILLRALGKRGEAEAAYREAVRVQTQLAADFPAIPEYRQELAKSHYNLGNLLRALDKRGEAETAYREALKIQTQLAADFPSVPAYRQDLARSHTNFANLLKDQGRYGEAEAACRDALKTATQLANDFPAMPDYQNDLAAILVTLATFARSERDFAQARRLLKQAVPHHRAALEANDRNPMYRAFFRTNRQVLAETCLDQGDHGAAADAADQLLRAAVDSARDAYNAACLFVRCMPLAQGDSRLSEAQRKERAQAYAGRALASLRQAVQSGYKNPADLEKDTNLDSLRSHPEFQKLLRELETRPKNGPK